MSAMNHVAIEQFRVASERFLAGHAASDGVIDTAVAVLAARDDAPVALVAIASIARGAARREELVSLVDRARRELSLPELSAHELDEIHAHIGLAEIAEGRVGPVEGANRLWSDRERFGDPFGVLPELIQLLDAWETSIGERESIEDDIRSVARRAIR